MYHKSSFKMFQSRLESLPFKIVIGYFLSTSVSQRNEFKP